MSLLLFIKLSIYFVVAKENDSRHKITQKHEVHILTHTIKFWCKSTIGNPSSPLRIYRIHSITLIFSSP